MTRLQTLMQKEVSRKEFFGIMGLALCAVLGMGPILKMLTGKSLPNNSPQNHNNDIYGGK